MKPENLIEKISFMRTHQLETVSSAINQRLRFRLADCISIIRPPASVLSMLAIDLAYATHRHWRWADTEMFAEIYIDYLCDEYALERGFAEIAHYEACSLAVSADSHSESPSMRGDIFLRYLLMSTIAHRDPMALADEMGFGERFFVKLLNSIEEFSDESQALEKWDFPDLVSRKILKQIESIQNSELSPIRQLSTELVRFRVYEFNREITTLPSIAYGRMVIDILTTIAKSSNAAADASHLWLPVVDESKQASNDDLALINGGWESLVRAQLVFQVGSRRRGGAMPFALTDYSEWLLALSCGPAWIASNQVNLDNVLALPKYLQAEVIRSLPKNNVPMLVQLLTERINTCQPAALIAAVEQISKFAGNDKVSALVQFSLKLCKSPWSRAALCRSLSALQTPNIGQILKEVADSDESMVVRDAALSALLSQDHTS